MPVAAGAQPNVRFAREPERFPVEGAVTVPKIRKKSPAPTAGEPVKSIAVFAAAADGGKHFLVYYCL